MTKQRQHKTASVVGPEHCSEHRAHTLGCLNCAAEVAAENDDSLDEFLARMEHIGWERPDGW